MLKNTPTGDYYLINAYNPATPSFCSDSIIYLCKAEELKVYIEEDNEMRRSLTYPIVEYFNGISHKNWFDKAYVTKIKLNILEKKLTYDLEAYNFINLWGYENEYFFKNLRAKLLYCQIEGIYYRFEYIEMDDLHQYGLSIPKRIEHYKYCVSGNMGNQVARGDYYFVKHQCEKEISCLDCDQEMKCTLYEEIADYKTVFAFMHKTFKDEATMLADYNNPEMINLDTFFFDLHGDG